MGGLVALLAAIVPDEQVRIPLWIFIYAAVAVSAVFCWNRAEAPTSPNGWLFWAAASVPVAGLLFAIDWLIGWIGNPDHSMIDAITSNGRYVVTFAVSPLGAFIALVGLAAHADSSKGDAALHSPPRHYRPGQECDPPTMYQYRSANGLLTRAG